MKTTPLILSTSLVLLLSDTADAACDPAAADILQCLADELASTQADLAATEAELADLTEKNRLLRGFVSRNLGNMMALDEYVTVDAGTNSIFIDGANVYVRSGAGATDAAVNGYGNLVVGYDEDCGDDKSGSHNLVVGPCHSYTNAGGFVAGNDNTISGQFASVTGGYDNKATADDSSVTGGYHNVASYFGTSVTGGESNTASGFAASVSGGYRHDASGDHASVSGGYENVAFGDYASVSGGVGNVASGVYEVVP